MMRALSASCVVVWICWWRRFPQKLEEGSFDGAVRFGEWAECVEDMFGDDVLRGGSDGLMQ